MTVEDKKKDTDAAPAVCVWTRAADGWMWGACNEDRLWTDTHEWCPSCGKPIAFTEAK